jgi:PTS system mannose-specific IIC component
VSALELLPLALLGAVLGLDVVSFPQAQLSRPIVAATLGGAMVGAPVQGLLAGAALELIALDTLPFGASRYPEWGSASVVAGALYGAHPAQPAGAMTMAVIIGVATSWLGGWTMIHLRRLNARWARSRLAALERGDRRAVVGLQLAGLTADLVRGGLLTFVALAVLRPLLDGVLGMWGADARTSRALASAVAATVAAGAAWKLFHSAAGARWFFLGGLALGLALMRLV